MEKEKKYHEEEEVREPVDPSFPIRDKSKSSRYKKYEPDGKTYNPDKIDAEQGSEFIESNANESVDKKELD